VTAPMELLDYFEETGGSEAAVMKRAGRSEQGLPRHPPHFRPSLLESRGPGRKPGGLFIHAEASLSAMSSTTF